MTDDDIFIRAIEFPDAAELARYLDEACDGNEEQKARVASLLRAHQEASRFLTTPAMSELRAQVQEIRDSHLESEQDKGSSDAADETTIQTAELRNQQRGASEPEDDNRETVDEEFKKYLSPSTRPNWLGRLAHYEIEEILGHGAFGVVAKAFDEKLHRVVAIKMLRPELATISPPRKRFIREARTAAAVTHENIVGIYAVEEDPVPYLVMEFVPGQTLQSRLNQKGPLEITELLTIALQVARGLAAAHKAKLIHRDIKPANILLTCDPVDRTKISDFGLARAVDDASLTSSGVIAGTPLYMAPEQARGETLDNRADLFSLGSVMYQMVCGRPPFRAATTMAVLKRVCDDTPRSIQDLIPETPKWLSDIIFRLLEKSPDDRFQSADEVVQLLESCQLQFATGKVSISGLDHSRKPGSAKPADRQLPSFAKIALLLTATSLLILIPVGYFLRDAGTEAITRTDLDSDTRIAGSGEHAPTTPTGDADQQILSLIELMGGRVNAGPTHIPGDRQNLQKGETAALSGMKVDIFFDSDNRNASDENLEKLSSLLIQRPDIQLRCLHLGDAPITNRGLKSLKALPIDQLSVGRTRVNGDEWANDLGGYQIRQWCLIPNVSTSGLLKFLAAENVKNMDLPVDKLTPDIFAALNTSALHVLGLQGPGPKGWPAPEMLEKLKDTNLTHINFVGPDLPQNYLQTFHDLYPHLNVGLGSGTVFKSTLEGRMEYWEKGRQIATGRDAAVCSSVPDSYRIEFSARGSDSKMFLVVFPVGDSNASLILGGFRETGECLNGLGLVDGKGLNENPAAINVDLFADNKLHRVVLNVTPRSVNATVDGKVIVEWSGEPDRLSIYKWLPRLADCPLYIKSINGAWDVSDLSIEAIGDANGRSPTDQEIIDFVKSVGGRLTQGDPPLAGTSLTAWPSVPSLASDVVHFDFRRSKLNESNEFGDEQLTRLAELLKLRPDIKIGVLNLVGTNITNEGLLSLGQVPIEELLLEKTNAMCDEIAEQLATFPINGWDFGSSISSDSLAVFAKNPNLRGISLDSATVDAQSLSVFANSKLRRLQLFGGENRSPPTVDQLSGIAELTDLYLPNYGLESDINALSRLRESLPKVKVHTTSYADRLPLPRQYPETDLEILSLVESVGGHVRRPFKNSARLLMADNPTLSAEPVSFSFSDNPKFTDSVMQQLGTLLQQRPDIKLILFWVDGTPITNVGLQSLTGVHISQINLARTSVNGDEIANEASEFDIREWLHVPGMTDAGWPVFFRNCRLDRLGIPPEQFSQSLVSSLNDSSVSHLQFFAARNSELPYIELVAKLVHTDTIWLFYENVPQTYLDRLHEQAPHLEIRHKDLVIRPDISVVRRQLETGKIARGGLNIPVATDVPESYRLQFKARAIRPDADSAMTVRFPIAQNAAVVTLSGWPEHPPHMTGLALVDGVDVPQSPDMVEGDWFADGETHDVTLTVTPQTVDVAIDNKMIVQWKGDPVRLRPYEWLNDVPAPLSIRTHSEFFLSHLKLEPFDPADPISSDAP